ncbi:MAG: DUF366 family protein [Archaeoglobaceae archaeon]
MDWVFIDSELGYDGSQIRSLWAYREAGIKEDSVISFIGSCDVRGDAQVDYEKVVLQEEIYSPKMLHFIVEHFDEVSLRLICTRQRFLTCLVQDLLDKECKISREGHNLFWNGKKLTVSTATISPVSAKIHFGVNVESNEHASLQEMGFSDPKKLALEICRRYAYEMDDLEGFIRKIRPNKSF